jgi:hypothetical protein
MALSRQQSAQAHTALRTGSVQQAIELSREALRIHEQNVDAMLVMAEAYLKQGKHELAQTVTGSALAVDPKLLTADPDVEDPQPQGLRLPRRRQAEPRHPVVSQGRRGRRPQRDRVEQPRRPVPSHRQFQDRHRLLHLRDQARPQLLQGAAQPRQRAPGPGRRRQRRALVPDRPAAAPRLPRGLLHPRRPLPRRHRVPRPRHHHPPDPRPQLLQQVPRRRHRLGPGRRRSPRRRRRPREARRQGHPSGEASAGQGVGLGRPGRSLHRPRQEGPRAREEA